MQSEYNKTLRVVQITDSHLFADPTSKLNGLDTEYSLQKVMDAVLETEPDLIIFTGDLVDRPEAGAYLRLKAILEQSSVPVFCLSGNHDSPDMLKNMLSSELIKVDDSALFGNWQLVFLNSYVPNTHSGRLSSEQLEMLNSQLSQHPRHSTLVCLHHHPVSIGSPWMDSMALDQAQDLFNIIDQYPQVKGVIWGHIHQDFEQIRNAVLLLGTPSTCVQFMPGVSKFRLDDKPPGYRWLNLLTNGEIETGVTFLTDFETS